MTSNISNNSNNPYLPPPRGDKTQLIIGYRFASVILKALGEKSATNVTKIIKLTSPKAPDQTT